MKTKQVIVVRKDIKMPEGKLAAQVAHASLKAILDRGYIHDGTQSFHCKLTNAMKDWMNGDYTKIVVCVKSEDALKEIYEQAHRASIPCSLIRDLGKTVFKGKSTCTAVAVGPGSAEEVDAITKGLRLV